MSRFLVKTHHPLCLLLTGVLLLAVAFGISGCGFLWRQDGYAHPEIPRPEQAKHPMGKDEVDSDSLLEPGKGPLTDATLGNALDYVECLNLALERSPYFVSSALDIDIQKVTEDQKWYQMFPSIDMRLISTHNITKYNKDTKWDINGYGDPTWRLSLLVSNYNPWVGYYGAEAQKIFTDIAVERHLAVLETGATKLAEAFIDLDALEQSLALSQESVRLAQEGLDYTTRLASHGEAASIETTIAQQQLDMATLQLAQGQEERRMLLNAIKRMLGIPVEMELRLDTHDAARQIMGDYSGNSDSFEDYLGSDHDMRMTRMSSELQKYNIKLAWAAYVPTLSFNIRTPDPTNDSIDAKKDDYFFQLGFTTPLFDWGERYRNIEIAQIKQLRSRSFMKEKHLRMEEGWERSMSSLNISRATLKTSIAGSVLEQMQERKVEILYQAGTATYDQLLSAKGRVIREKLNTIRRRVNYEKNLLQLYDISGHLGRKFIVEEQDGVKKPAEDTAATPTGQNDATPAPAPEESGGS